MFDTIWPALAFEWDSSMHTKIFLAFVALVLCVTMLIVCWGTQCPSEDGENVSYAAGNDWYFANNHSQLLRVRECCLFHYSSLSLKYLTVEISMINQCWPTMVILYAGRRSISVRDDGDGGDDR